MDITTLLQFVPNHFDDLNKICKQNNIEIFEIGASNTMQYNLY
jgi:hypothetical protein